MSSRPSLEQSGFQQEVQSSAPMTDELIPTKEDGEDGLPAMGVPARRGVR